MEAADKTLLMIDDDQVFRGLMRRVIEAAGFTGILEAEDGSDGLTALERERPDVVILDIMMHGMNGLQFLKSLRAGLTNADASVPVVVVTGVPSPSVVAAATNLDCDGFIKKDGGLQVLATTVIRALQTPVEKRPPVDYLRVALPDVDKPESSKATSNDSQSEPELQGNRTAIEDLSVGDTIARDIDSDDGTVLITEGTVLTAASLGRVIDVCGLFDIPTVWTR